MLGTDERSVQYITEQWMPLRLYEERRSIWMYLPELDEGIFFVLRARARCGYILCT